MAPTTLDWLLDSDPAIRWQVMRDLTHAGAKQVSAERSRVALEGWGAQLLDLQSDDGLWGGGVYTPKWTSTTYSLLLLRHLGIDPAHDRVRSATDLVRDRLTLGALNWPFFEYSTEVCITGMALALGSYFLADSGGLPQPEYLLEVQRADGGWNCHVDSDRSSFHTTISVLEGLVEYERAVGGDKTLAEARSRAHDYFLERRLMFSLRTGEVISKRWLLMSFPPRWHYDLLRALDYLREAGTSPDPRADEAVDVIRSKQRVRWHMAAPEPASRGGPFRDGGGRRQAEPLEHAARPQGARWHEATDHRSVREANLDHRRLVDEPLTLGLGRVPPGLRIVEDPGPQRRVVDR